MMYSLTKSFLSKMMYLHHCFFLEYSHIFPYYALDAAVRATGAQDSRRILSNITVYNYDTTHLQKNPQRLE